MPTKRYRQSDYNRILDDNRARTKRLSQNECEKILMSHGISYQQAKNGTHVYLNHGGDASSSRRGSREEYEKLLNGFNAPDKQPKECIEYLKSLGFGYRQAQTAVYQYRTRKGLIGK